MASTNGVWRPNLGSRSFPTSLRSRALEICLLLGLGMLAVLYHAATRGRVSLAPGHQGIAWLALLMLGRLQSRLRWAAVTTAVGAAGASLVPALGFADPLMWAMYLAAGAALDAGYWLLGGWHDRVWLLALLGGLGHVTKPLLRLGINVATGWPYGSLMWGVAYPVATHFLFGAVGAGIGAGLVVWLGRRRPER